MKLSISKTYLLLFSVYYLLILLYGNKFLKSGFNPQILIFLISLVYVVICFDFYTKIKIKNKMSLMFCIFTLYSFIMIILSSFNFVGLFNIVNIENSLRWVPRQSYFIFIGLFIGIALYRSFLLLKDDFIYKNKKFILLLLVLLLFMLVFFNKGDKRITTIFFPVLIYSVCVFNNKYLGIFFLFLSFFLNVFNFFGGNEGATGFLCFIITLSFILLNHKNILEFKKHIYIIIFFAILGLLILGTFNLNNLEKIDTNAWWRLVYWIDELKLLAKTYFIGVGFGTSYHSFYLGSILALTPMRAIQEYGVNNAQFVVAQHNSVLNIFFRLGILGLIFFILFNFYVIKNFKISLIKYKDNPVIYKSLKIILLGFILSIIHVLFNVGLESPRMFISYLLFISLSVAYNVKILYKNNYEG